MAYSLHIKMLDQLCFTKVFVTFKLRNCLWFLCTDLYLGMAPIEDKFLA